MNNFPNIALPSDFAEKISAFRIRKKSASGHTLLRPKGTLLKREFTLEWQAITDADRNTLDTFFNANQAVGLIYTHFKTGVQYIVNFVNDDIEFQYVAVGWWKTKITLGEI